MKRLPKELKFFFAVFFVLTLLFFVPSKILAVENSFNYISVINYEPIAKLVNFLNDKKSELENIGDNFEKINTVKHKVLNTAKQNNAKKQFLLSAVLNPVKDAVIGKPKQYVEKVFCVAKDFVFPGACKDDSNQDYVSVEVKNKKNDKEELNALKKQYDDAIASANELNQKFNLLQKEIGKVKADGVVVKEPIIEQKTVERTIEKIVSGISQDDLNASIASIKTELNNLNTNLTNQINNLSFNTSRQSTAAFNAISLTNRIDSLSGTRLSGITVSGVSGLTDSDIPDTITASNYLPLIGGTISGDLTISGNATLGVITLQNATAGYFTATSTTQASTFPYASTTALTVSGTAYINGLNGPLQANNGLVSATTSIGYQYGGTGLTDTPSFGQILRGTGTGYALVATSTLGINTSDLFEGSNLFWTDARFDNRLSATTTLPNLTTLANLSITGSQVSNLNTLWDNRMSATTTLPNITTLASLATVGTITSGTWNGTTVAVNKGGTGQTSFGQGWLNSDGTILSASTSPTVNYLVATSTTVTSTFAGGLTVAGHCVTGDTRLRRRRKKKNGSYEYDEVAIKDIQPGDEVASLDEETGKIVWSKVNALMDMGVKKVYKLTTASGKTIRTTAEHPYLVKNKEILPKKAIAFIDYANVKAWLRGKKLSIDLEFLAKALISAGVSDVRFYYGSDSEKNSISNFFKKLRSFGYTVITKPIQYFKVSLSYLLKQKTNRLLLGSISNTFEASLEKEAIRMDKENISLFAPKANFDVEISVDAVKKSENIDVFVLFSGDGDFAYLLKELKLLGKKTVVVSGRKSLSGSLVKEADKFVTLERLSGNLPGLVWIDKNARPARRQVLKNCTFNIADLLGLSNCSVDNLATSENGLWKKVVYLKEGMEIAVNDAGSDNAVFDKITKIEFLPEEQVYDIEVEGTHNFIGNDIVAHNTYIGGTASSTNLIVSNSSALGTVSSGLWSGSAIGTQYGGTGQNFSASSGLINLYSGTASAMATSSLGLLTTDVAEGTNQYWTNTRFDNRLSATTTLPNITTLASLATVGTITSGTWNGSTVGVPYGGTGWASIQSGTIPYGNGSSALSTTTAGTAGNVLALLNGVPTWTATTTLANIGGSLNLGTQVTGNLSVNNLNGGTGASASTFWRGDGTWVAVVGGGGGASGGTWSTTTSQVSGQLINFPINNSDIVTIGHSATTSAKYWFDPNTLTAYLSGNIGIGTTSPNWKLSVAGIGSFDDHVRASYFTATSTTQASTFPYASTTALTVSGTAYINGLNGPLQANNGLVSATTSIGYQYGGTGLTDTPSFGQILRGTGTGYALVATSTLGINTSDLFEGSNLFWTDARFDNRLSATTTLPNLTILANLGTIGTITTGVWNGSSIGDAYINNDITLDNLTQITNRAISDTTGTLSVARGGTGQTSFGQGWLNSDGTTMSASTSPTVNYITATSTTATSTFAGGLDLTSSTGMGLNFGSNTLFYQNNQRFLTSTAGANGNLTIGYQTPTGLDGNGGLYNTGVGYQALGNATSTDYNTAFGYQALKGDGTISNTGYNTAIGYRALYLNTTGNYNTANGLQSLYSNTTGFYNTANGYQSLYSNTTGSRNTADGLGSLFSNTTGSRNTANGYISLYVNTTGSYNTAMGYGAGYGATADHRSVIDNYATFIGYQASRDASVASTTALTNITAIGKNARVGASNTIVLGGTGADAVNVGIGTTTPASLLNLAGASIQSAPGTAFLTLTNTTGLSQSQFGINFINQGYVGSARINSLLDAGGATSKLQFLTGGATPTVAMSIDGTNNVGIGITNPASLLEVGASTGGTLSISTNGNVGSVATPLNSTLQFLGYLDKVKGAIVVQDKEANLTGGWMKFQTMDPSSVLQDRIMIDRDGLVGIGTTTPWRKLSVTGTVGFDGLTGATGAGSLCLDANKQVVYNSASDACLSSTRATKHDIQTLNLDGLSLINSLQPSSFIYNQGDGRTRYGFIAEDTALVDDRLATHNEKGEITGIDDRAILSVVVKAVKEMNLKISDLQASAAVSGGQTTDSLFSWILSKFSAIGITFGQDKLGAKKGVFDGLEMKDATTGEDYCVKIRNGEWEKTKGTCGETSLSAISNSSAQAPTSSSGETSSTLPVGDTSANISTSSASSSESVSLSVSSDVATSSGDISTSTPEEASLTPSSIVESVSTETSYSSPLVIEPISTETSTTSSSVVDPVPTEASSSPSVIVE